MSTLYYYIRALAIQQPFRDVEKIIDKFLAKVAGGGFMKDPTPARLLTREVIGKILDTHVSYCRQLWRRSKKPLTPAKKNEILRKAAQTGRQRTVSVLTTNTEPCSLYHISASSLAYGRFSAPQLREALPAFMPSRAGQHEL